MRGVSTLRTGGRGGRGNGPRGGAWALLAVSLALLALAACSPKQAIVPNLEPETTLFVQGELDTVNHVVHLYWFGSDPDGDVVGYQLRLLHPLLPADTAWRFTRRTDSLFVVYTPEGLASPVLEVRAQDDDGALDPTPAVQAFTFSNQPPSVELLAPPGITDTTFASVTVTWRATDPDGDFNGMHYRVWLDGNEAAAESTSATTFTLPSAAFLQNGSLLSGHRTLYVQAVDDGGRIGAPDSTRWFVRAPVTGAEARLLIVDDVPTTNPANTSIDTMFVNTATRNLPAGTWTVLRLQTTQPFRSAKDVEQTFGLFDAVLWYRGTQTNFPVLLRDYRDGLAAYLDAGGKLLLEGLDLVEGLNVPGPLDQDFMSRYLGSDRLMRNYSASVGDSTEGWGNRVGSVLRSSLYADSVRFTNLIATQGMRGFLVRDTSWVALWARDSVLTPANDGFEVPVAVSVPQPAGGRAIVVTLPLRAANGYFSVPRLLAKMFAQLGLTGP